MNTKLKIFIQGISIILICVVLMYRIFFYEDIGSLEIPEEFTGKPLVHLGMTEDELLKIRDLRKVENESISYSFEEECNTEICKRIVYVFKNSLGKYKLKLLILNNEKLKNVEYKDESQCDSIIQSYESMVRNAIKVCQNHHGFDYQVYKHIIPVKEQNLLFFYIVWHTAEGTVKISYYPPQTVKNLIKLGESSFGNSNELLYDSDKHYFSEYQGFNECNIQERKELGF